MLMPPETVPMLRVGSPSERVGVDVEREAVETRDRPRDLVDRVLAEVRHRPVRGPALRERVEPHDALVRYARVVRRRLGDEERAGAAERAIRPRQRERAVAARLLAGAQHDLEPGAAAAERGDPLRRDHDRRRAALHVARPAAVEPVAVDLAAERVAGPVAAAERDRVEVPGEAQRGRVAVRARPAGRRG